MISYPQKPVSSNHLTERRFKPYKKANLLIKHLNFQYNSINPSFDGPTTSTKS